MFERFTERSRQVVVLAQDEARLLKHNYIGTEHLLLGLLRQEKGVAARVLDSLDITVEEVRAQVARIVGQGDEVATGQIPFTPRAKKALELALNQALLLGQDYIGPEHILHGLAAVRDGVAARILDDFDADPDTIRNEVIRSLTGTRQESAAEESMRRGAHQAARESGIAQVAHLVIDCPTCGTPIEMTTTGQPEAPLSITADDADRACPGCGKLWRISYTVSWEERDSIDG